MYVSRGHFYVTTYKYQMTITRLRLDIELTEYCFSNSPFFNGQWLIQIQNPSKTPGIFGTTSSWPFNHGKLNLLAASSKGPPSNWVFYRDRSQDFQNLSIFIRLFEFFWIFSHSDCLMNVPCFFALNYFKLTKIYQIFWEFFNILMKKRNLKFYWIANDFLIALGKTRVSYEDFIRFSLEVNFC